MRCKPLWAVVLASALAACGGGSDLETVASQNVTDDFYRVFPAGSYVLRSQAELESAWAAGSFQLFFGGPATEPPPPSYDFSRQAVVGLSRGIDKLCFRPRITLVQRDGENLTVHYTVPASSTLACLHDAPANAFALVPRFTGTASFVQDPS